MKAVIIGSGKVATLLGKSLAGAGHTIVQVAGRNASKTRVLAKKLQAEPVALHGPFIKTADIYLICVSDNAISEAAKAIAGVKGIVVHTSGTTPIAAVSKHHKRSGVLWPVVSIGSKSIRLKDVPLCIEAGDKKTEKSLFSFANSISNRVHLADSSKREVLHLAAVITNNFTNHLHDAAFALLAKHNLDREILYTLIKNTAANILDPGPEFSQTGPAVRGDTRTIDRHLKLLKNNPDLQEIYAAISSGIINHKVQ